MRIGVVGILRGGAGSFEGGSGTEFIAGPEEEVELARDSVDGGRGGSCVDETDERRKLCIELAEMDERRSDAIVDMIGGFS